MADRLPPVRTYYRSNISTDIITAQARVFAHLGIELIQSLDDDRTHAQWLDKTFGETEDLIIVCDVDAFPLNRPAFVAFIDRVRAGSVVGLEQVCNHLGRGDSYAGPMFLGCTPQAYAAIGWPSLAATGDVDVGQSLTHAAQENGLPVEMIAPQFAIQPKWPLGNRGVFGIGTFYGELDFFHLFESRRATSLTLFGEVADGVIRGEHDFGQYLATMALPAPKKKRKFGLFRKSPVRISSW